MVPGIFGGIFQAWQCLDVPKAFPAESSTCACVSVCVCESVFVRLFVCVEGLSQLIHGLFRQNDGPEHKRKVSTEQQTGNYWKSLPVPFLFPTKKMCSKRTFGSETGSTACALR